jgi:hypothetical protein
MIEGLMRLTLTILVLSSILLCGCQGGVVPVYSIYGDTNFAIKSSGLTEKIGVGSFVSTSQVDMGCRMAGEITLPRNQTPSEYIQKALENELKVANLFGGDSAKIVLSGTVERLFLSTTDKSLSDGRWDLSMTIKSSNGSLLKVDESYSFETSSGNRCKESADAFLPAVQNLIAKIFTSPRFKDLVTKNRN